MDNVKSRKKQGTPSGLPSVAKSHIPNEGEQKALEAYKERQASKPPSIGLKLSKMDDGENQLSTDHPDQDIGVALLAEAIGTTDHHFMSVFLQQIANAGSHGQDLDEQAPNFMLSVVRSIQPRDEMEAMLAAQMAAVHMATMSFARRLAHVDNIAQQDSAERAFNKLNRTFTAQMDALKKYRDAPQQRVHVEHVHVNEGGQAIVGNVEGGKNKNEG
jgi:hypothetical protein